MANIKFTETIADLLPHPQVLNFHVGMPVLPDWVGTGLRLMMGAGDLNQGGIPNIKRFDTYDVFFCLPWDWDGSLRQNVEYLIAHRPRTLLCFIDNNNYEHVKKFITLFAGRFSFIDGFGGHTPHLSPLKASILLGDGGIATNMYEHAETVISLDEVNFWLDNQYFKRFGINSDIITGLINPTYNSSQENELKQRLQAKAIELSDKNKQIVLSNEMLEKISTYSLRELQYLIRELLFEQYCPPNMVGSWVTMQKDWLNQSRQNVFIFTKVPFDFKYDLLETYRVCHGEDNEQYIKACKLIDFIKKGIEKTTKDDTCCMTVYVLKKWYYTYKKLVQNIS